MPLLIIAIFFTLGVSAFCSLLEAMILSTTTAEIESLKQKAQKRGDLLEKYKEDIEETSSAILALNTIANTLGAVIAGGLATTMWGQDKLFHFSLAMTLGILIFSEIIPKNIGVLYRPTIQPLFIYPLAMVRGIMLPFSSFCRITIRVFLKPQPLADDFDDEIILLAEKSAQEGNITKTESNIISNALNLDDIRVNSIMTPRKVVFALERQTPIASLTTKASSLPFSRIPLFDKDLDSIIGIVKRTDILNASTTDTPTSLQNLITPALFIPENITGADALNQLLKAHQQFAIIVDEFGSVAGVLTMEDIFENILGQEIYDSDDLAIDMRALARSQKGKT